MSEATSSRLGRAFSKGELLFREGERGDVMYVVQSGAVRITKLVAGQEKLLAVLGPGEFLGEMAILNGKPRTASATAQEDTRCLVIDAEMLEDMTANNSEIALRLIKKLARRLDSADSLVEVLLHHDPKARGLLPLARHADATGEPIEGGTFVRASTGDLAAEARVSEAIASEMLVRVGRFDIAHPERGGIVVTDVTRLRDFLEFLEPSSLQPDTQGGGESA